jgi:hypothetical protein
MPLYAPKTPEAPPRTPWWVTDLYWLGACALSGGVLWFLGWLAHRPLRPASQGHSHLPVSALGLVVVGALVVVVLVVLLRVILRSSLPGKLLGRTGGRIFGSKVWLTLRASTMHMWVLGPIGSGKTTLLANLIIGEIRAQPDPHIVGWRHRRRRRREACRKLGLGRGMLAVDPNGALTNRVMSRLSPEERARVTVIDPAADKPPAINLFAASDPEQAAGFIVSLFRSLPGGGTVGPNQLEILRLGVLGLARRGGATLLDLPRYLRETCGDSAAEQREVRGLCSRLGPFLSPSIAKVIGRQEEEDLFAAIDTGRTLILRMRAELSEEASALLAAVFLARGWDRIQRREPDAPHRHATWILDELGGLVRESRVLIRMLDQTRSRNVCVVCAHQRLSQLAAGMVDALRGSALTRIVFRLADADEAEHMVKHLAPPMTKDRLMALPDYRAVIRRKAKGRPAIVTMYDVPKPWKPARRWHLVGPLRRYLKVAKRTLRRVLRPLRSHLTGLATPSVASAGVAVDPITTQNGHERSDGRPETPSVSVANKNQSPIADELDLSVPSSPVPRLALVSPAGLRPTPRDMAILSVLADQGVATTDQIVRGWWPGRSDRAAQLRLRALTDAKLVQRLGPNGRPHEHYALTSAGAGLIDQPAWRPVHLEEKALPHRLAVVDFGTALLGATHVQQEKTPGAGWDLTWQGESVLRNDPTIPEALRPDSRIVLTTPTGRLTAWVELDRGTEGWSWLGPKLERLAKHGGADALLVAFETPGRATGAVKDKRLPVVDGLVVACAVLAEHIRDPLGAIWSPSGGGDKITLPQLVPADPSTLF